ncbi:hypothetical protein HDV05_007131 [Chytridiales sp. JEL 0842]|nr:hypothetical protein HDV05_007131 [Chytridiales sp. JEL 0842]
MSHLIPPACCRTGHPWSGTPQGEMSTLGGVPTYFAPPPPKDKLKKDKWIVILTDVFGMGIPNLKLLADEVSKYGYNCIIPDILQGEPWDAAAITLDMLDKPKSLFHGLQTFGKLLLKVPFILSWLPRHGDAQTIPIIESVLQDLHHFYSPTRIGLIGYCFGGRYAICKSHPSPKEEGCVKVDAFIACHPGQVKFPGDIEKISIPGFLALAEWDSLLTMKTVEWIRQILRKDGKLVEEGTSEGQLVRVKVYEGTMHGFASRGDEMDEKVKAKRDDCLRDCLEFFDGTLV